MNAVSSKQMCALALLALFMLTAPAPAPIGTAPALAAASLARVGGLGARASAVDVASGLAFLGVDDSIAVLDGSAPASPVAIAQLALGGKVSDVRYANGLLYVANEDLAKLQIVDVADPLQPRLRGSVAVPGNPTRLAIAGGRAYIAAYNEGIQIVDVSNADAPKRLGGAGITLGSALDIAVAGQYSFLTTIGGLEVFDVSAPATPRRVGQLSLIGPNSGMNASAGAVVGNRAYLAVGADGLVVIDISAPTQPTLLTQLDTPGWAVGVAVRAGRAYLAEREGLRVVDVSDPGAPQLLGSLAMPGVGTRLALSGDLAYVADTGGGLRIATIDGATPTLVGVYGLGGNSQQSVVAQGRAYVASYEGLQIVDMSTPARPRGLGLLDLPGFAYAVAAAPPYAYVLSDLRDLGDYNNAQLTIVDVRDPASPQAAGYIRLPRATGQRLQLVDSSIYVLAGGGDIWQINVTNPAAPQLIDQFFLRSSLYALDFVTRDGLTYAAAEANGLQILALRPGGTAERRGSLPLRYAAALTLEGNTAYVINLRGDPAKPDVMTTTLELIDVANPAAPVGLGAYPVQKAVHALAVQGGQAYLVTDDTVEVVDVHDPAHPTPLTSIAFPGTGAGAHVADKLVYITGYGTGLQIYETERRYSAVSQRVNGAATLSSADKAVSLEFATGALPSPSTVLEMDQLHPKQGAGAPRAVVRSFLVEARDAAGVTRARSAQPYTVAVRTTAADVARQSGGRLGLAYWDGTTWVDLPACANCPQQTGVAMARLDRFTELALVADAPGDVGATPTATLPRPTSTPPSAPQREYHIFLPLLRQ